MTNTPAKFFTIQIDNEDRDDQPEMPWTAVIRDDTDTAIATGFGAFPAYAARDAINSAARNNQGNYFSAVDFDEAIATFLGVTP